MILYFLSVWMACASPLIALSRKRKYPTHAHPHTYTHKKGFLNDFYGSINVCSLIIDRYATFRHIEICWQWIDGVVVVVQKFYRICHNFFFQLLKWSGVCISFFLVCKVTSTDSNSSISDVGSKRVHVMHLYIDATHTHMFIICEYISVFCCFSVYVCVFIFVRNPLCSVSSDYEWEMVGSPICKMKWCRPNKNSS